MNYPSQLSVWEDDWENEPFAKFEPLVDYSRMFSRVEFDVCDTLGRAASSLLSKGVQIELAHSPCTNCVDTIYIPQAMRRYLSSREIDLVRYMVAHEQAHIQHSDITALQEAKRYGPQAVAEAIFQALEDIRIEAVAMKDFVGNSGTFALGRRISLEEWAKFFDPENSYQCLIALIYGGHISPGLRHAARSGKPGLEVLREIDSLLQEFYARIDSIPEWSKSSGDLLALLNDILSKWPSEKADDEDDGEGEGEGDAKTEIPIGLLPPSHPLCTQIDSNERPFAGGGMCEMVVQEALKAKGEEETPDGEPEEEKISQDAIKKRSYGFGLDIGTRCFVKHTDPHAAENNYQYGLHCAGMCQHLVDRLRGTSRKGFSKPKVSGLRVAAAQIPRFILGETFEILRRRHKQPHTGTACVFLVDDSGSMGGQREVAAWRGAATLAIACERAKIPCAIVRYSTNWSFVKMFTQPSTSVRKEFSINEGGGTRLHDPMKACIEHLAIRNEEKKFMFILTDGQTGYMGEAIHAAHDSGIRVIPILLGGDAVHQAMPGRNWSCVDCVVLPRVEKPIGPMLVEKLTSFI